MTAPTAVRPEYKPKAAEENQKITSLNLKMTVLLSWYAKGAVD
jgi:hypothetical protein